MPLSALDGFDMPFNSPNMQFGVEPIFSALQSLLLITRENELPGVADWVTRTARSMSRAERRTNELVVLGFHYVVLPNERWDSFPEYLDYLASQDAEALREKMLTVYDRLPPIYAPEGERALSKEDALGAEDDYIRYLRQRFPADHIVEGMERQAYQQLIDPPQMRALIVDHLRSMWQKYLAKEWERAYPILAQTVRTFQQLDLRGKSFLEAAQQVTGQALDSEKWTRTFREVKKLVFVPHAHVGPYILKASAVDGRFMLFFGPRMPHGLTIDAPDLSRAEILTRLSALADENRLRILRYLAENGEQRSQEVMDALALSQSAASRHLTQLSAAGYLTERRCDGAKCYALNPDRITDTLQAISNYLLVRERSAV